MKNNELIPAWVIEKINDLDIVTILEQEGLQLKKQGADYWCCCPFHGEKTPSFKVSSERGFYKCFGCQKGGNAITFIMEFRNMSFTEAVDYIASRNNIRYEKGEPTAEEREARFRRDRLYQINRVAMEFFMSNLKAPAAKAYVDKRGWSDDVIQDFFVGYAPGGNLLLKHLRAKGWKDDKLLLDAGLAKRNDETGDLYDAFRLRLMFPVFSRTGNVLGFSGRYVGDIDPERPAPKYLNTGETEIFKKKEILFGWYQSLRTIRETGAVILCEGNPDVLRLHQIGKSYAVAPMGTALTEEQIELIKTKAKKVVIIGDTDDAGVAAVEKQGKMLVESGMEVQVMSLPEGKDPDEYFLMHVHEFGERMYQHTKDFVLWYAARLLEGKRAAEMSPSITEISRLLAFVSDENTVELMLGELGREYKAAKDLLRKGYKVAKTEKEREDSKDATTDQMVKDYGFYIKNNCFYGARGGSDKKWCNFILKPILHIRDEKDARRIFLMTNERSQESVIKFKQSELTSLKEFQTRTESAGNYVWEAGSGEMTALKKYLYENVPSADEIRQLGWQKQYGFYAWGNGGLDDGVFVKADKFGIVEIRGKKYYFPGCGLDAKDNATGYQHQRKFTYAVTSDISLREFSEKLIKVFADNAKVGLCFLIATLFRDIVVSVTTSFPILNLFGPKGTGKSELGHSLTSFFIPNNVAPNINNTTKAALAEAVAEVSNAIVHLDEYKNNLDLEKREFLKGLWDGTGRSRINLDNDKRRETTAVDCGVIMSGQEMPTADIALFNRLVFLTFSKSTFSDAEKRNYEDLKVIEKRGLTHLTAQILTLRNIFQRSFRSAWDDTLEDLNEKVREYCVEDRTLKNWATVLAAYKAVESELDLPFDYKEMLKICASMCVEQNNKTRQSNELSGFWETVEVLVSSNKAWMKVDYHIKTFDKPQKICESKVPFEPRKGKQYLCINFPRLAHLYASEGKSSDVKTIPRDTLRYYLAHSPEFVGTSKSMRFRMIENLSGYVADDDTCGKSKVTTSMMFDYDMIRDNYTIDLDVSRGYQDTQEPAEDTAEAPTLYDDLPD